MLPNGTESQTYSSMIYCTLPSIVAIEWDLLTEQLHPHICFELPQASRCSGRVTEVVPGSH